jgi:hypothetical protein
MKKTNKKIQTKHYLLIVVGFALIAGIGYYTRLGGVKDQTAALGRGGTQVVRPPCNVTPSLTVNPISATAVNTPLAGNNNDTANFQVKFSVTANGCDAYISANPSWVISSPAMMDSLIAVQRGNTVVWQGVSYAWVLADNMTSSTTSGNWKVDRGTTQNFTAYVYAQDYYSGGAGQYRGFLKQLRWSTNDAATPNRVFTTGLGTPTTTGPFHTPFILMN